MTAIIIFVLQQASLNEAYMQFVYHAAAVW